MLRAILYSVKSKISIPNRTSNTKAGTGKNFHLVAIIGVQKRVGLPSEKFELVGCPKKGRFLNTRNTHNEYPKCYTQVRDRISRNCHYPGSMLIHRCKTHHRCINTINNVPIVIKDKNILIGTIHIGFIAHPYCVIQW